MWQQTTRLPTYCRNGSDMSFVGQEPVQNGQAVCKALEENKIVRILDGSVCVFPYPGSMLSRAGKSQQLNRTKLKLGQEYEQATVTVPNKAHSQIKINW